MIAYTGKGVQGFSPAGVQGASPCLPPFPQGSVEDVFSAKAREMFGKGVQGNPPAGVTGASPGFPPFPKRWVEDTLGKNYEKIDSLARIFFTSVAGNQCTELPGY